MVSSIPHPGKRKESGVATRMLPPDMEEAHLLVLGLDQGSIGMAGQAFVEHEVGALVHTKWDKFHRVVRDCKLSFQHAGGGVFLKAQLYSSYLWSVNKRPFGTGAFGEQKRRLMCVFLAVQSRDSPLWRKYGARIADDLGMAFDSDAEQEAVWQAMSTLGSFNVATEAPKLGRWFSWNTQAHVQLREYHTLKMVLEYHLEIPDPDDGPAAFDDLQTAASLRSQQAAFRSLKASDGGLRLCYLIMSSQLLQTSKIMYVATQATWSWYTAQVRDVKTPKDNLDYLLRLSRSGWQADRSFRETLRQTFYSPENLRFMGLPASDSSEAARKLLGRTIDLVWHLLAHRAWSSAARYGVPPEQYVDLLADPSSATGLERRQRGLDLMRRSFYPGAPPTLWSSMRVAPRVLWTDRPRVIDQSQSVTRVYL